MCWSSVVKTCSVFRRSQAVVPCKCSISANNMFLYLVRVSSLSLDPPWGSAKLSSALTLTLFGSCSPKLLPDQRVSMQMTTSCDNLWPHPAAFWLGTKDGPDTDTVAVLFSPSASCKQLWLCSVYCVSSSTWDSTGEASHMTVWRRDYTGLFITSSCHSFSAEYLLKPPFNFSSALPRCIYSVSNIHSNLTNRLFFLQVKWEIV